MLDAVPWVIIIYGSVLVWHVIDIRQKLTEILKALKAQAEKEGE